MINHNGHICIKTGKPLDDIRTCLTCIYYKKGKCSPPGHDILRQTENGYELYYPLLKVVRRVANFLGISTNDVIKILEKKYGIKIGRTTLLKYHKIGLLNQVQKIGRGRAKGVYSLWENETPLKFHLIDHLKRRGISLEEFRKFQDIAQLKKPQELKKYEAGPLSAIAYGDDEPTALDIIKFFMVIAILAAIKLKVEKPSKYDPKVIIDENDLDKSRIEIILVKEAPGKKVVFTKKGCRIVNVA